MARLTKILIAGSIVSLLALGCSDDDGTTDTGTTDTGTTDTGTADTGTTDTGTTDTGTTDTGTTDTGTGDTGASDTGMGDASTDASGGTPCGTSTCDPATQVCFECACGGPTSFACVDVPTGCEADRTCTCIGPALCTTGLAMCTDRGDNHVFCDTGLD